MPATPHQDHHDPWSPGAAPRPGAVLDEDAAEALARLLLGGDPPPATPAPGTGTPGAVAGAARPAATALVDEPARAPAPPSLRLPRAEREAPASRPLRITVTPAGATRQGPPPVLRVRPVTGGPPVPLQRVTGTSRRRRGALLGAALAVPVLVVLVGVLALTALPGGSPQGPDPTVDAGPASTPSTSSGPASTSPSPTTTTTTPAPTTTVATTVTTAAAPTTVPPTSVVAEASAPPAPPVTRAPRRAPRRTTTTAPAEPAEDTSAPSTTTPGPPPTVNPPPTTATSTTSEPTVTEPPITSTITTPTSSTPTAVAPTSTAAPSTDTAPNEAGGTQATSAG